MISHHVRMLNVTLDKLKLIANSRDINGYENKSEDLIKILSKPKLKISLLKNKRDQKRFK